MDTSEQIEKSALEEKQLGTTKYEIKKFFKKLFKRYLIDGFSGMAQGLFVTLIAGTIIKQLGEQILKIDTGAAQTVGAALVTVGKIASILMGAGIGAGVAKALKGNNLVVFSSMVAGMIGAFATQFMNGSWITVLSNGDFLALKSPGNPVGAYISAVIAAELGILVSGKTPVDILVVPLTVIF
ncbi:MAG TPA: PTS sugar transporter subunit IIC, partial [Eubacteriales bacterium]|nr:PTS sugar transporter subunit IIC [Eubacteriales bacterium]